MGVYDGHGTTKVAAEAAAEVLCDRLLECMRQHFDVESAIHNAFVFTDEKIRALDSLMQRTGTTATVTVLRKRPDQQWEVTIGWVGDSRAVQIVEGCAEDGAPPVQPLTTDHRLTCHAERERVEGLALTESASKPAGVRRVAVARRECRITHRAGPEAVFNEATGVSLTTTRSLGDHTASPAIVRTPEVTSCVVGPEARIVVATDGLWDAVTEKAAAALIRGEVDSRKAAKKLSKAADAAMT